ncbi:hypothetical protein H5410_039519 [Solanum commersonii]|uniref:Uncharacterized protein n=1 Tax=Solanum commersonii TaxID=4109 RepID=A0A9J5XMC1_SOLCO|nr:hypothetical protein H5410_039519 [Solanum commersonii]
MEEKRKNQIQEQKKVKDSRKGKNKADTELKKLDWGLQEGSVGVKHTPHFMDSTSLLRFTPPHEIFLDSALRFSPPYRNLPKLS